MQDQELAPVEMPISDAELVAEMAAEGIGLEDAPEAPEAAPDGAVEEPAADAAPDEAAEAAEEPVAASEPAPAVEVAEPTDKALEAIERRDRAARERAQQQMAQEREQIAAERARISQEFPPELRETVKALRQIGALGKDGVQWEQLGRYAYAQQKAAEGDPKYAEVAANQYRQSDVDRRIASVEQQNQQLLQTIEQQRLEQQAVAWVTKAEAAASDETPVVKRWLAKDAASARLAIVSEAQRLENEYGELPDVESVVKSLETRRRTEIEALGYTLAPAATTAQTPTPKATTTAPKAPAAISRDLGTSTQTSSEPMDYDDLWDSVATEIDDGAAEV